MTGEEKMIHLLKNDPQGSEAKEFYDRIQEIYSEEFGITWLMKEQVEAAKLVDETVKANRNHIFRGPGYMRSFGIADAVEHLFKAHRGKYAECVQTYIGTRQAGHEEYSLYCKGLFFFAGYRRLVVEKIITK